MPGETPIGKFIGRDALQKERENTRKDIESSNKSEKISINKDSAPGVKVTVSKKWIEKAGLSEKGGQAAIRNFLKEQTKIDTSSDEGFVQAITKYQEKHKKDKKLTADGILGWKTLEVMEQEMEGQKYQDKYQDNPEMDSEHVLTQAEYDAKNDERAEKLTELGDKAKNITQSKFRVTEVDPEGNPLQYNSQLKAWVGSEGDNKGKVLNTDTGEFDQTEEQMLAANKTKAENENTQKKVEGLLGSIDATITESEPGDTNDVIQKFLSQIPENGLSESQLAHLNNSLKERGFKIAPYNDEDHYANGIESHYFIEETGFGAKKDYENLATNVGKISGEQGNNNLLSYEDSTVPLQNGKRKISNLSLDALNNILTTGKGRVTSNGLTDEQRLQITNLLKDVPAKINKTTTTFEQYIGMIKDPTKAAFALAPTDKPGVLPGNLGEWGVKYQKQGDIAIKIGEDGSLKSIITKEGETPLDVQIVKSDLMKGKTLLKLPNGDILKREEDSTTVTYITKEDQETGKEMTSMFV